MEKSIPQGPNWGQLSLARQEAQWPHRDEGTNILPHHMQTDTMATKIIIGQLPGSPGQILLCWTAGAAGWTEYTAVAVHTVC